MAKTKNALKMLEPVSKVPSATTDDLGAAPSSVFTKKSSVYPSGYTSGFFARLPRLAPQLVGLATKVLLRPVLGIWIVLLFGVTPAALAEDFGFIELDGKRLQIVAIVPILDPDKGQILIKLYDHTIKAEDRVRERKAGAWPQPFVPVGSLLIWQKPPSASLSLGNAAGFQVDLSAGPNNSILENPPSLGFGDQIPTELPKYFSQLGGEMKPGGNLQIETKGTGTTFNKRTLSWFLHMSTIIE